MIQPQRTGKVMSITIELSKTTEARLREQAVAKGVDITGYASELLERAVSQASPTTSGKGSLEAWDNFVASMRDWGKKLPAGHFVDDSRESIYEGRGE